MHEACKSISIRDSGPQQSLLSILSIELLQRDESVSSDSGYCEEKFSDTKYEASSRSNRPFAAYRQATPLLPITSGLAKLCIASVKTLISQIFRIPHHMPESTKSLED
ncbi:predicted protein [Sclerotinia sclerotiorum 1980 UF-70]|uniref:Uncharacterized protein n=1 Tax=Sclerotinia sclerotiorum (strain ATCC 18683 / 1980 / Ss-1) TaxID=665079 RepID=A7F7N6_SCLS1|nr:predicted protein [Sclerotinia sclerotiorum 1980 UF-70]EDN98757.1 predicted protein [Sclerotinia sclerotiorum 1980 UF-70]